MTADGEFSIRLSHVGKGYPLYDSVGERLRAAFWPGSGNRKKFAALTDVSLEVKRGEFLGIIGRNGSGKTTLLELICGISQPSSGEISVSGRVAALLELGAGFNPELSGRDNVYLNGNILGLSNSVIDRHYPKIVEFADIGEFIDKPVKIYSSGMYVRLAFAVQACIEPDLLIVDEALAVGDIFFRQKCYQYIARLIEKGTTVILVSHAMGDIEQFCSRVLLLDHGNAVFLGDPTTAVKKYYLMNQPDGAMGQRPTPVLPSAVIHQKSFWPENISIVTPPVESQISKECAVCTGFAVLDVSGQPCHSFAHGALAVIFAEFEVAEDISVPIFGGEIVNDRGLIVHGKTTLEADSPVPEFVEAGTKVRFKQQIELSVASGEYTLSLGFSCLSKEAYAARHTRTYSDLSADISTLCIVGKCAVFAVVRPMLENEMHLKHHGVADLPGTFEVELAGAGNT